jgi:hypothetical protein
MAISVAPLTTTVMSSVEQGQAGVASGINNAVSRTGSLLAIAVLGVVMLQVFGRTLEQRLLRIDISEDSRASIYAQRIKLTALDLPQGLDDGKREAIQQAVAESFVAGFRVLMVICAASALASGLSTWFLIGKKKLTGTDAN